LQRALRCSQASGSATPLFTSSTRETGSWSASVARAPQSTHHGCSARNAARIRLHRGPYPRCCGVGRCWSLRALASRLCFEHRPGRSTHSGQPGVEQTGTRSAGRGDMPGATLRAPVDVVVTALLRLYPTHALKRITTSSVPPLGDARSARARAADTRRPAACIRFDDHPTSESNADVTVAPIAAADPKEQTPRDDSEAWTKPRDHIDIHRTS
jgi:hypothetical protein